MQVQAWMQMGCERRETVIEIPDEEYQAALKVPCYTEVRLEEYVRQWMECEVGWGWSGGGFENDFGCMEGSEGAGLAAVSDSAIPNTRAMRLDG